MKKNHFKHMEIIFNKTSILFKITSIMININNFSNLRNSELKINQQKNISSIKKYKKPKDKDFKEVAIPK